MHTSQLRKLIQAATPAPLRINRYDNASCINYQVQSEACGVSEREDHVVIANIRDDECPRAKATAELIVELYNRAEDFCALTEDLDEARSGYHKLDANWQALHDASVDAIREALNMPHATIPEMVEAITNLLLINSAPAKGSTV